MIVEFDHEGCAVESGLELRCECGHLLLLTCGGFFYIQGVPGGKDLTSGECSLGQTIPI